jgi:hypothetical protein
MLMMMTHKNSSIEENPCGEGNNNLARQEISFY